MRLARLAAPLLVIGLAVTACTGSAASTAPTAGPASAAPASAVPASAVPAPVAPASAAPAASTATAATGGYDRYGGGGNSGTAAGAPTVNLARTTLGNVLVDGKGMTLYMFTPDTATTSACSGGCATNWPPLTGGTPTLGTGLDASDFRTITRSDGTKQVTFHGHALYTFANDQSAGQTNGQGQGGKWYVLGSDGNPIK
jgi:predicted lipoprotein with Yx(FWY)xxD motif